VIDDLVTVAAACGSVAFLVSSMLHRDEPLVWRLDLLLAVLFWVLLAATPA
jgi:hypothetical protein